MWLRRVMLVIVMILLLAASVAIGWYAASWPVHGGGA
jgi:hypothetical protein